MKRLLILSIILCIPTLAGCTGQPTPDIEATVAAAVAATLTAIPTPTPIPTPTIEPTETPIPKPTATPTPEPLPSIVETKLDNGEVLYQLPAEGFSMTLPPDWHVVDMNTKDAAELFEIMSDNEQLKAIYSDAYFQQLAVSGIEFYAMNVGEDSLKGMIPATINVFQQNLRSEPTLEQFVDSNISQLQEFFNLTSEIEQETVTFGDKEAIRLTYVAANVDPYGRTIMAKNSQYLLLDGSTAYVITLFMPEELAADYQTAFQANAETFSLLEE